jgi:hypothetical protein
MNRAPRELSLTQKLLATFLTLGVVPAVLVGVISYWTASHEISDRMGGSLTSVSQQINDTIDRNLFERYGDVQAFAANPVLQDRAAWYRVGSEANKIAEVANHYVQLYGIYDLSIVVDRQGRVVAASDKDVAGKPLDTSYLYEQNFAGARWFTETLAGRYLTAPGSAITGTVVEDAHFDDDVKRIFKNEGLVVTFSAPIVDGSGTVIGVLLVGGGRD